MCWLYQSRNEDPGRYPDTKKIEAVRLLQGIGYKVAVAPVDFQGDSDSLKQIPPLAGLASGDPEMEQAFASLCGEQTLVITGTHR